MNADELYMRCAIEMGEKARLLSPPNPWVGCVIVKNNHIIGEGHTLPPGEAHAEVCALRKAGDQAEGATAYVTLEPCAHYGRTPPCTQALIKAGIKKIFIALEDPDPQVQGKGIKELTAAGVEVILGLCHAEAATSLRPYLHHRRTGRAYCLIKTALTIDGRVAAKDGTSQWITSHEAREDAHGLRSLSQAILIGSGTAIADKSSLTVRHGAAPHSPPLRIVFDRRGRVPATGPLFDAALAPTMIITSQSTPKMKKDEWEQKGARIYIQEEGASLESILSYLGSIGIIQIMVEGGAALQSSLLREKAAQELVTYIGGVLVGDQGKPAFIDFDVDTLADAERFTLTNVKKVGSSVRIDYLINQSEK